MKSKNTCEVASVELCAPLFRQLLLKRLARPAGLPQEWTVQKIAIYATK